MLRRRACANESGRPESRDPGRFSFCDWQPRRDGNTNIAVQVTGSANFAAFIRSAVTPIGIVSVNSGTLVSIGRCNFFATGSPTQAVVNFQ